MDEDLPTDPYPFLCNNCGGQFKTHTAFLTHFSPKRHACAFADNVVVKNLKLFTAEAVASSLRKLQTSLRATEAALKPQTSGLQHTSL